MSDQIPVSDLVRQVIEQRKMSISDIAAELDRDSRLVRALLKGERTGESFRDSLSDLAVRGTVTKRPPRRRRNDGSLVPVRTKDVEPVAEGEKHATRIPEDTGGTPAQQKTTRFSHKTSYGKNGDRLSSTTMHPSNRESRVRGFQVAKDDLRRIAMSQAHKDKNVALTVTLDNGREIKIGEKGGFFSSSMLKTVNQKHGGSFEAFVKAQLNEIYPPGKRDVVSGRRVVGISMVSHDYKDRAKHSNKPR
ncbi:hypothetical protein [Acaricomes phytoseiuli]|uniref:hypothetical protein n=1 Tax=Acaricomes phytoseiuli TaxID=291968 RepID=UPI00037D75D0|nr:hypothetical protein [Acaricomes phytoseiuli]